MTKDKFLSREMDAVAQRAIDQAIERHRRLGESIAIWQNGQVVVLTADQIPLPNSTEPNSNVGR